MICMTEFHLHVKDFVCQWKIRGIFLPVQKWAIGICPTFISIWFCIDMPKWCMENKTESVHDKKCIKESKSTTGNASGKQRHMCTIAFVFASSILNLWQKKTRHCLTVHSQWFLQKEQVNALSPFLMIWHKIYMYTTILFVGYKIIIIIFSHVFRMLSAWCLVTKICSPKISCPLDKF